MLKQKVINMHPYFCSKNPKANFLENLMNISYCKKEGYENVPLFLAQKSQSQFSQKFGVRKLL
jgi:hypothetical protein